MKICIRMFLLQLALRPARRCRAPAQPFIDLDVPGVLQTLYRPQPADCERVAGILRDAQRLPAPEVEGWVRTACGTESVRISRLLRASCPPKRRLAFSLGEATDSATVTVSSSPARAVPIRSAGHPTIDERATHPAGMRPSPTIPP